MTTIYIGIIRDFILDFTVALSVIQLFNYYLEFKGYFLYILLVPLGETCQLNDFANTEGQDYSWFATIGASNVAVSYFLSTYKNAKLLELKWMQK